ncbi:TonB-dependent receptor plug domain-containing protein [Azospirillum halopraeferens]|uniref:TonB-dependent receptor plug domain-containing protein n=1 Tax=Azospirillum halopraeferens TaxID=34010 RepID=UPI0004090F62|nr:TonB-dependent receptor [Azospirillum halopraeferens]
MIKKFFAVLLCGVATLPLAAPAGAQTIDYGSLEQLFGEPVTTSATGKPQRASEVPAAMEIISAGEIRQSGLATLPDILQRVVGLDVMRSGMDAADVSVRGYNQPYSPRLLVLVNGRQVYLDHYGMTAWSAIPVELAEIRQIEVVKGPNTALFGFNAVGGVVNIVTYNPLYDSVNNVTARYGTQNFRELSGVASMKLGEKTGLRVSAGGFNAHEFDTAVNRSEESLRLNPRRRSVAVNGLSEIAPGHQMALELTKSNLERFEPVAGQNRYSRTEYDTWSAKVAYTGNTPIGLVEASLYRNGANIDLAPNYDINNTVTVARLQDLFKIGTNHSVRLTAEFRRNEMNSTPDRGADLHYDVYSVGGMWDWSITDRLSLVNALRLDHLRLGRTGTFTGNTPYTNDSYDRKLTEPSFNSGIVFKATDVDTVRFMIGRGVQVPSMIDFGLMQSAGVASVYGSPSLDPTIVTNYEIGYDRTIDAIGGGFRASVFYQTNEDMLFRTRTFLLNRRPVAVFDNMGDSSAIGLETSLKGRIGEDLGWKLGYAFQAIDDDLTAGVTSFRFEDATPQHKLSAELNYRYGQWSANLFGLYATAAKGLRGTDTGTRVVDVPNYFLLSGSVGYDVTETVRVALTGQNITQDTARLSPFAAEERRVFLTLSASF